jgi:starch-binding outer membrane protein SusE/F
MKKHILTLLGSVIGFLLIQSCKDQERDLNLNITGVNLFFSPNNNVFVRLQPATSASVVFEWEQAKAEDGTLVLYEVLFDKENGDFSNPVAKRLSDAGGSQSRLTLAHKDLNKIGSIAGVQSLATGKLKWTVRASKGTNAITSKTSRVVEIQRPAGFADIPTSAFLSGSATEGGTDLSKAITMKRISSAEDGVFEIFTSLKAGTFKITDGQGASAKVYSVNPDLRQMKESGETTVSGDTKMYRIQFDFGNAAATFTEITKFELWYSVRNDVVGALTYVGNSQWKVENLDMKLDAVPWGKEERYKFRLKVKNSDGTTGEAWYGSQSADNSRWDASTPAPYFYMLPIGASQWDFTYKFPLSVDGKKIDVTADFQPTISNYTHRVTIK